MTALARPDEQGRVRGWCPSLHRPMASGDGLLARVKPVAATLTAHQMRALAEAAERFGNGQIEITRRGNLQARGLSEASVIAFAAAMVADGLANADPQIEAARSVLAAPLSPADDPTCAFNAHDVVRDLEALLADETLAARIPGKFGVAVCGGGVLPIARNGLAPGADITLSPAHDGRVAIRLTGGKQIAAVTLPDVPHRIGQLLHVAAQKFSGDSRRMTDLVARHGETALLNEAEIGDVQPVFEMADHPVPIEFFSVTSTRAAVLAGAPFGRMSVDQIRAIARIAEAHGDGTVRLTPWRRLVLPGVASTATERAMAAVAHAGLITEDADPRLRVAVCAGAPGCASGMSRTLDDANTLASSLPANMTLHVSGCPKGCAHSGVSDITLVAREAGYDLIRRGDVKGSPERTGLSLDAASRAMDEGAS